VNVLDSVVEETYNVFVKRVLGTCVNIRYNVHLRYKRQGHELLLNHAKDAEKAVLRKMFEHFDEVCVGHVDVVVDFRQYLHRVFCDLLHPWWRDKTRVDGLCVCSCFYFCFCFCFGFWHLLLLLLVA